MTDKGTVLIIEDSTVDCNFYRERLEENRYRIEVVANLTTAEEKLKQLCPDVVLLDLRFPPKHNSEEGLDFLKHIKSLDPAIKVIVVTGARDRGVALKAIEFGADDFVEKGERSYHELPFRVNKEYERLQIERELAKKQRGMVEEFGGLSCGEGQFIVGTSEKMRSLYEEIKRVAVTESTVLIQGEPGTGKELVAHAIHHHSLRKDKTFSVVNINAIPTEMVEAELFGVGKSAATGVDTRRGRFLEAQSGTLFLDEIGELSLELQPKLLRAIENKEIQPIGQSPKKIDVRIITATNRDLGQAIEDGRFRRDLHDRLNVMTLRVPPLRERRADILMLAEHFLEEYRKSLAKRDADLWGTNPKRIEIKGFQTSALILLMSYPWPGNVRELKNHIEQAVISADNDWISAADLKLAKGVQIDDGQRSLPDFVAEVERLLILDAISQTKDQKAAAKELGVPEATLRYKMDKYGIARSQSN